MTDDANLELTADEMRAAGRLTLDRVVDHIVTLADQPAHGYRDPEALCRALREPEPPETGSAVEPLLDTLFRDYIPHSLNSAGPSYLAFIPGGGLFPAALADLIADGTNRYTGVWFGAPALVQLEANVLDWIRGWMQFPAGAAGLFTTGGSMASFNAILCARERRLGPELRQGVLYASDQAHHSVLKSARLAGILPDRVRSLPVDETFRLRLDALADAVADDRRRGLRPFLVVSSAGTANTGAVDPLEAVADFCGAEGLWHHVDGAYGAFFHLCDELRPLLAGLPRADSLTLDPHKGLFLPYGTGCLLVRDGAALRAVHTATGAYMPPATDPEFYDPSQHGPDLSRGFPGLRVWLVVKMLGVAKLRAALAEKRALAVDAAARIARIPGVVMDAWPQLSLLAWHLDWPGATREAQDAATRDLLDRVNRRQRILLTGCTAGGRFLARACILSFRTRRERVEMLVQDVAGEVEAILKTRNAECGINVECGMRNAEEWGTA